MPRFLLDVLTQFKSVWARLDAGQRWLMGAVVALTVIGLTAMVWYAGRPDYQVVVEADDPRDLAAAVRALTQANVPFERDGRTVSVPREVAGQARSVLFEAGVATGGTGIEEDLLSRFTLDRDARKDLLDAKNRARAERAVLQIDGVVAATVTSSKPPQSVFRSGDAEALPRASVLIRLRPGAGFRRIAAAALDATSAALGIPPERVVVVDAATQERHVVDARHGGSVAVSEFLAQQRARSDELTERARAVLDRLYPDQARVQVVVELDPNWELREEKIVPEAPILVTDKTTKSDSSELAVAAAGDPSATAQVAEASAPAPRTSKKDTTVERTYEPFSGTASRGKLAPDVRRISVALVLDEKLQLSGEKLDNVANLVKQCVGFDAERDGFAIHVEKFPELPLPVASAGAGWLVGLETYLPVGAQLAGVALVLFFLRGMLRRASHQPATAPPAPVEEVPEENLTPEENIKRMRRDIEKAISEDPAAVSRMLETWLTEVRS